MGAASFENTRSSCACGAVQLVADLAELRDGLLHDAVACLVPNALSASWARAAAADRAQLLDWRATP